MTPPGVDNGMITMKLLRYGNPASPTLGVLLGDRIVSLAPLADRYPTMLSIIAGDETALTSVRDFASQAAATLPLAEVALLAPIERPGKFMAIGMNYRKHIAEAARLGVETPKHQFWFNKQTSCISGPFDDIDPGVTEELDYEVELCAVIGQPAKGVRAADAPRHVIGYTIVNDVSARDWQMHTPTFTMGKSFDTHGPIGPWIVTADEIGNPHDLGLRCLVNGELRQESNTGGMVANLWQQIEYLSTAFTLDPGDLIATGTPEGVAAGMNPPVWLKPGDVVRCEIDRIGAIENRVAVPVA